MDEEGQGQGQQIKYSEINSVDFEVMLPSACSFIVDGLTFSCRCSTLHVSAYMAIFRCV
jgi:hypothetical protein